MFGIIKGLALTMRHALGKVITVQYPDERIQLSEQYRGALKLRGIANYTVSEPDDKRQPPCTETCPASLDIRAYLAKAAQGDYLGSYNVIKERCAIPGIVGRVCFHPCEEQGCRRGQEDKPISINAVKRFVSDQAFQMFTDGKVERPKPAPSRGKKVAIVGAGPAGLNCAYYLALWGYSVTIFEREMVAGGMLKIGIPDYRLPRDVLEREVQEIADLGVDFQYGQALGKEFTVDSLMDEKGFDSVFLAFGAYTPVALNIPGEDAPNVMDGEAYLRLVNLDLTAPEAKSVIVVGAGNTAMDCVRVARRQGAESTIVYRRSRAEMPAAEIEIHAAEEEQVNFELLSAPLEVVLGPDGRATGLKCQKMQLGAPDASGRRSPVPIEGSDYVIEGDLILSAVSRKPDQACLAVHGELAKTGVDVHDKWCTVLVDKKFSTSRPGVFAGGDLVNGAATVVQAYADARNAADSIHEYLSGESARPEESPPGSGVRTVIPVKSGYSYKSRAHMEELTVDARINNYLEIELGLTPEQLKDETDRCLYCRSDACIGCGICVKICPDLAISIRAHDEGGKRVIDEWTWYAGRCSYCGLCREYCPTDTIEHTQEFETTTYDNPALVWDRDQMLRRKEPVDRSAPIVEPKPGEPA